ncbi:MAG: restriction endonuclease subunit S [Ruminococcaceae bacterium]|nr:restriction endonuclease subunit S [Oscillospiraceae bacterium]
MRLQNFVDFIGGSQPPKSTFEYTATKDNIRLIQIRDYKTDKFLTYIPRSKARRFCNKDDVMIGRYGPPIFQILRGLEGSYNVALMKAVANTNIMLNDYLYYLLQDGELLKMLESLSDRTCGQDGINMYELNRYIVGIPPLNEQTKIIDKLVALLPVVDKIEADKTTLQDLIKQTKSKILDLAIRGKLVPQDPNDEPASVLLERIRAEKEELIKQRKIKRDKKESVIFKGEDNSYYLTTSDNKSYSVDISIDLPDNWTLCYLSELFNVCSAKRVRQSDWRKEGVPFFRAREIVKLADNGFVDNELFISEEHFLKVKEENGIPKSGDLMISGVGTIGKIYIVKDTDRFYYKDASVLCFENRKKAIDSRYAKYMLESEFLQEQMRDHSKGTTVDTITISAAMEYICVLPPLPEQTRIVKAIETAFTQLDEIANSIA